MLQNTLWLRTESNQFNGYKQNKSLSRHIEVQLALRCWKQSAEIHEQGNVYEDYPT